MRIATGARRIRAPCSRPGRVATLATATAPAPRRRPEHRADPSLTTYVQRVGPVQDRPLRDVRGRASRVAAAAGGRARSSAMDARLVDARGNVIPQHVAMLHHLVFTNGGPDDARGDRACPLTTTRERFYGTSEELRPLTLPPGYGYPTNPADQLARAADGDAPPRRRARVLPRVPRDRRPAPGHPGQAVLAERDPVRRPTRSGRCPGDGTRPHRRSREFTMPEAGRIVAVGGHLHGGALDARPQPAGLRRPHARALQARPTRRQGRPAVRGHAAAARARPEERSAGGSRRPAGRSARASG